MRDICRDAANDDRTAAPQAPPRRAPKFCAAPCLGVIFAIVLGLLQAAASPRGVTAPVPPQRPAALSPSKSGPLTVEQPPTAKPLEDGARHAQPPAPPPDEPIRPGIYNDGPGTLLRLPPASHARMHQCAIAWQNMKATGAAVEKTWFNFALECLAK